MSLIARSETFVEIFGEPLACISCVFQLPCHNNSTLIFLLVEKFDEAQALKTELSKKQQVCMYALRNQHNVINIHFVVGGIRKSAGRLQYGEETLD